MAIIFKKTDWLFGLNYIMVNNTAEEGVTESTIDTHGKIIELPDKIATYERSDFKKSNLQLTGIISLTILIFALFFVSAVFINNFLAQKHSMPSDIEHTKEIVRKSAQSLSKQGKEYKKYSEILKRYNKGIKKENRVELNNGRSTHSDYDNYKKGMRVKVKLDVFDIISYVNLLAHINGFYKLERFTLGKRDPNLLFAGELIKYPDGRKTRVKRRDFLWKYAILYLKRNYKHIFFKILKFKKKIRMFEKRKVDNFKKISIMKQGLKKALKNAYVESQRKILKGLINRLDKMPVIYK